MTQTATKPGEPPVKNTPPVLALENFDFEAKVFKVEDVWFERDDVTGKASFHVPMGSMMACVPVSKVMKKFSIDTKSKDGQLLLRVERALLFVPTVRPGDSIPSELIDGTASWKFEACHKLIAEGRLAWHLLQWAGVDMPECPPPSQLVCFAQGPLMQNHGAAAWKKLLEKSAEKTIDDLQAAMADIATELAYVEALKEHFVCIFQLQTRFARAMRQCHNEKTAADEFGRILALSQTPIQWVRDQFTKIIEGLADMQSVLFDVKDSILMIRSFRDQLHLESRKWDPILEEWRNNKTPAKNVQIRRHTYHFLASRWSIENQWAAS
ncbi:hypothetical protein MNBD_ALPHA06-2043 [hydrothermal vent metagenome]|uniref:Uncharacterized protein n=1 Tax=hydrothermal vent metagenome TaxID=652676 RepID=A0A3B0RG77_9ZZZZ